MKVECLNDTLVSCDADAEIFPNELYMAEKGIHGIGEGVFDDKFEFTTYVDFRRNEIVEVGAGDMTCQKRRRPF